MTFTTVKITRTTRAVPRRRPLRTIPGPPPVPSARLDRTHDNTAARHDHILAHLHAAGFGALADLSFRSLDNDIPDPVIVTSYITTHTHKLTRGQKETDHVPAIERAPSNTASPTSRTGRTSSNSVPTPPAPPLSCALCSS